MTNQYPTFSYFREITITDHPGTGYEYTMTVAHETGMDDDFADLRFSDASATIPYWIKSHITGTSAIVTIKLTAATTIFKHWGNESATSESNGDNVFTFFEGGESGSPSSKWTLINGTFDNISYSTDQYVTGAKSLKMDSATATAGLDIKTPNITISNYIIELSFYDDGDSVLYQHTALAGTSGNTKLGIWTGSSATYYVYNLGSWVATSVSRSTGWHTIKYIVNGGYCNSYIDDTEITTDGSVSGDQYLQLNSGWDVNLGTTYYDNVIIRNYAATEPTLSYGEVQTVVSDVTASFSSDVQTGTNPLTVTFTDSSTGTPTSWLWDFGDSETSETQSPEHIYAVPGTYTVILTATNAGGSDTETKIDYITVTPASGSAIIYVRVYEMDHKVGTTQKHSFQIAGSDGSGLKSTCTNPVISAYIDGTASASNPQSWTISAFDNTLSCFWLTVPSTAEGAACQNLNVNISCDEGEGQLFLNIVPDYSLLATASALSTVDTVVDTLATSQEIVSIGLDVAAIKVVTDSGLATSAEITAIKGAGWTDETLVTIQAAAETGGASTGGNNSELIIPNGSYTINASAKTITLTGEYESTTTEQILSIYDLSIGCEIYDSNDPRKRIIYSGVAGLDISVADGVITYVESATSITNDDILMIKINKADTTESSILTDTVIDNIAVLASGTATTDAVSLASSLSKVIIYVTNLGASTNLAVTVESSANGTDWASLQPFTFSSTTTSSVAVDNVPAYVRFSAVNSDSVNNTTYRVTIQKRA